MRSLAHRPPTRDSAGLDRIGVLACRQQSMPKERAKGELVVRCDCGFEARGTEDTLIPAVQKHGRDVHNMPVTREQVLAMARPI
jgi:predicted small metal-binding protein